MPTTETPDRHYAGTGDQVTRCGRVKSLVLVTGNSRQVTCATCLASLRRS